jgi:hypothetical protein
MKTKVFSIYILFFVLMLGGCTNDNLEVNGPINTKALANAADFGLTRPDDAYNYPVLPGSDKWKTFSSLDEKTKACEISETLLKKMSNEALAFAWLEYPLLSDWIFMNNLSDFFVNKPSEMNLYKEMSKREGMSHTLVQFLFQAKVDTSNYHTKIMWQGLELICAQKEFISGYSKEEMKQIVDKFSNIDFNETLLNPDFYLLASILNYYGLFEGDDALQYAIEHGEFSNTEGDTVKNKIPEFYKIIEQ